MKLPTAIIILCSAALASCSQDTSDSTASISINQSAEEIREEIFTETGIDLVPLDFFGWDLELSDLAGQVVVMNFWASWCIPCLDTFPTMLDIATRYPPEDVRFISVNLDDFEDEDAYISALDFLNSTDAKIENYHLQHDLFEVYQFFGLENIPTIIVYNRFEDEQNRLGIEGDLLEPQLVYSIDQALALPLNN